MSDEQQGRLFRQAWIDGVRRYFPGEPKASYILPWEQMALWEQQAAIATFAQIQQFVQIGNTGKLTRAQRGQFVSICWNGQVLKHLNDPKPTYVLEWSALPHWQQETDAHIFDQVEQVTQDFVSRS